METIIRRLEEVKKNQSLRLSSKKLAMEKKIAEKSHRKDVMRCVADMVWRSEPHISLTPKMGFCSSLKLIHRKRNDKVKKVPFPVCAFQTAYQIRNGV